MSPVVVRIYPANNIYLLPPNFILPRHFWLGYVVSRLWRSVFPFYRDLRGNAFECDCRAKWLMTWLKNTNATVSDVVCAGPEEMKDKRLNDMASLHNECISTGETHCSQLASISPTLPQSDIVNSRQSAEKTKVLIVVFILLKWPFFRICFFVYIWIQESSCLCYRFCPPSICDVWISVCWHIQL